MRFRLPLLVTIFATLLAAGPLAAQYTVLGTVTSELPGGLERTETTVQAGANPLDQFKLTRLARDVPAAQLRAALFFLPPLSVEFTTYEQTAGRGGIASSIAGFFALRGFDVYGFSSRLEGIPGGTCEAGILDCSTMADWNLQTLVDDIAFARSLIEAANPGARVFVGGFSLGAISGFAVLDAHPQDYAGAFLWEGMLATPNPQVQALNQSYCAALEAQLAAGILFDGVGGRVLGKVTKIAQINPGGLTPIPLFPPTLSNHQVLVASLSEPAPGPVSMPLPGYIQLAGSVAEDRFFFASERRLTENVARFNDYIPTALVRDVSCSLAGVETSYVDNLGSFEGPVLAIGGGRGFGASMQDNLDLLTGSDDVELLLEPDFGHVDHLFNPRRQRFIERPILRWLQRQLREP